LFAICLIDTSIGFLLATWAIRLLECMFFLGLLGCVSTVIISWVSIVRSSLTEDTEADL